MEVFCVQILTNKKYLNLSFTKKHTGVLVIGYDASKPTQISKEQFNYSPP